MGVEVKQTLERDHDINLPINDIRLLTFSRLLQLSTPAPGGAASPHPQGAPRRKSIALAPPESYELRHLVPTDCVVKLNPGPQGEGIVAGVPLFVVHPIEGSVFMLGRVMGQIGTVVYGLQHTADAPSDSIQALAQYYIQASGFYENNSTT